MKRPILILSVVIDIMAVVIPFMLGIFLLFNRNTPEISNQKVSPTCKKEFIIGTIILFIVLALAQPVE